MWSEWWDLSLSSMLLECDHTCAQSCPLVIGSPKTHVNGRCERVYWHRHRVASWHKHVLPSSPVCVCALYVPCFPASAVLSCSLSCCVVDSVSVLATILTTLSSCLLEELYPTASLFSLCASVCVCRLNTGTRVCVRWRGWCWTRRGRRCTLCLGSGTRPCTAATPPPPPASGEPVSNTHNATGAGQ